MWTHGEAVDIVEPNELIQAGPGHGDDNLNPWPGPFHPRGREPYMYVPQPGDIGLINIRGPVGLGIRFGQWLNGDGFANYDHAFVVVGNQQLVEAEPGGARLNGTAAYPHALYLRCPDQYRKAVADAVLNMIGVPYSFLDYASLAAHRLRIPAPHLRAYIRSSGHLICSQLADEAAKRGGWHLFNDGRWAGDVTPGDLYELYLEQGRKTD